MSSKRILGILGAMAAIAAISTVMAFENTDAKESALHRMPVSVGMGHVFEMTQGQTMTIPFNLTNLDVKRASSVNVYVTEQGSESLKNAQFLASSSSGIDMSLDKYSSTIPVSTEDAFQTDQMSVIVSVPEDIDSGLYEYALIVELANDSLQVRKYFYINVV